MRHALNVDRGQTLELVPGPVGTTIAFPVLPTTTGADVVLPDPVLRRIERHSLEKAQDGTRCAPRAAPQARPAALEPAGFRHDAHHSLPRPGSTVLMVSGQSLHLIGTVAKLARDLPPAVIVLEPALAGRPGRVDVAVEIGLPDAAAGAGCSRCTAGASRWMPPPQSWRTWWPGTGLTASFVKELLRRALLEALPDDGSPLTEVTGEHLSLALDDQLDSTQSVTPALLGVPADQSGRPQSTPTGRTVPGLSHLPPSHRGVGWMQHTVADRDSVAVVSDN